MQSIHEMWSNLSSLTKLNKTHVSIFTVITLHACPVLLLKGNMAEEEKSPLLVNVEDADDGDEAVRYRGPSPRQKVKSLYQSDRVLGRHSPYTGVEDEVVNISASSSMHNFNLAEEDCVVSIFVVAFDTKAGKVC